MRRYVMMLLGLVLLLAGSFGAAQGPEIKGTVIIRKVGKYVQIEVSGGRPFRIVQAIPELQIGAQFTRLSRFSDSGGLIFFMSGEDFAKTKDGDGIRVKYQGSWNFGNLDKSKMAKANPPSPFVSSHSRSEASSKLPQMFSSNRIILDLRKH